MHTDENQLNGESSAASSLGASSVGAVFKVDVNLSSVSKRGRGRPSKASKARTERQKGVEFLPDDESDANVEAEATEETAPKKNADNEVLPSGISSIKIIDAYVRDVKPGKPHIVIKVNPTDGLVICAVPIHGVDINRLKGRMTRVQEVTTHDGRKFYRHACLAGTSAGLPTIRELRRSGVGDVLEVG